MSINYWPLPITTNTIEIKYADDDFESSFNAWSSLSIPLIWYENNVYDIRLFLKEEKGREIITRDVWMTIKHLHENNIYAFSILDEIVT